MEPDLDVYLLTSTDAIIELNQAPINNLLSQLIDSLYSSSSRYHEGASDCNKIGKWKTNARYSMSEVPSVPVFGYKQVEIGSPVSLLSNTYFESPTFTQAFQSIIWVTYRYGFDPIIHKDKTFTSDTGWGCTIRVGQMLFLNTLKRHFQTESNLELLELIQENLSTAPFSLHRIVETGKSFNKNPGDWYSPSLISHVLKQLSEDFPIPQLKVYVFMDSLINIDQVSRTCSSLILVPLMLGISEIQAEYHDAIKFFLSLKYSVGIIGGIPKSALYLIGYQDDHLLFLDPHLVQAACTSGQDLLNKQHTYQCTSAKLLPFTSAESSISLGFYIRNSSELDDFYQQIQSNNSALHGVLSFALHSRCESSDSSSISEDYVIV